MGIKQKYIKDKLGNIIIFPETLKHSDFKGFEPVSAGFVQFFVTENIPNCSVYGKSVSLEMKSDPKDVEVIQRQILRLDYTTIEYLKTFES